MVDEEMVQSSSLINHVRAAAKQAVSEDDR